MEKVINIDGKDIKLRCSAATYIKYRSVFKEDLFTQLQDISKNIGEGESIPDGALATMYQAAYIMAMQGDKNLKVDFETWMDQFELTSSIQGVQGVLSLLMGDQETIDEAKKKDTQLSEK